MILHKAMKALAKDSLHLLSQLLHVMGKSRLLGYVWLFAVDLEKFHHRQDVYSVNHSVIEPTVSFMYLFLFFNLDFKQKF